ncbi:hypothetical protein MLD38_014532 [Melastoma candidum]|uniref:Uncharacterized protein n=1 Tax=Melastoma candidum TaxID=119954 RepID=A0ACB9RCF4_9MYRT|nr:hypothetical protein MLD38_014532 [Melastoma candidum]
MSTDISPEGSVLDPTKCSKLSLAEKRELIYQVSKRPNVAAEALQAWSRQDILQVLCAEMGKERKYTGLTKLRIIEQLLKLISENKSEAQEAVHEPDQQSSPNSRLAKRRKKTENPSRLTVLACHVSGNFSTTETGSTKSCKNSACRATLNLEDKFCGRCSCCICFQFDDNKDPSLWLNCSSDPPHEGNSCGMSCHLECALKDGQSGIVTENLPEGGDGCFLCPSCGKVNGLLGCWRKQLLVASDTRRVDILCYRLALSKKLLKGIGKYQKCLEIVDEAINMLEAEVGPLTGLPVKIGRGIVNRLSTGSEVQKLCSAAVDLLDSMVSPRFRSYSPVPVPNTHDKNFISPDLLRFEDIGATSLTLLLGVDDFSLNSSVQYSLWHKSIYDADYPTESTQTLHAPSTKFVVTGLNPVTEYSFKIVAMEGVNKEIGECEVRMSTVAAADLSNLVVAERSLSPTTNCSSLSNPSSVEDESNNVSPSRFIKTVNQTDDYLCYGKDTVKTVPACAVNCSGRSQGDVLLDVDDCNNVRVTSLLPPTDVANQHSQGSHIVEVISIEDGSNVVKSHGKECVPFVERAEAGLPITPCKLETSREGVGRIERSKSSSRDLENGIAKQNEPQHGGSTTKKRGSGRRDDEASAEDTSDRDFEYYVKAIRWLECEGHIEKNFRQKFLTWYSLRATVQEVRIVKVFIDTFTDDPKSLAEQLIDTFSDCISSKTSSSLPPGFCMKLWH